MAKKSYQERKTDARILRASLKDRIDLIYDNPNRTKADTKLASKLAKQHNRLLMKY